MPEDLTIRIGSCMASRLERTPANRTGESDGEGDGVVCCHPARLGRPIHIGPSPEQKSSRVLKKEMAAGRNPCSWRSGLFAGVLAILAGARVVQRDDTARSLLPVLRIYGFAKTG